LCPYPDISGPQAPQARVLGQGEVVCNQRLRYWVLRIFVLTLVEGTASLFEYLRSTSPQARVLGRGEWFVTGVRLILGRSYGIVLKRERWSSFRGGFPYRLLVIIQWMSIGDFTVPSTGQDLGMSRHVSPSTKYVETGSQHLPSMPSWPYQPPHEHPQPSSLPGRALRASFSFSSRVVVLLLETRVKPSLVQFIL